MKKGMSIFTVIGMFLYLAIYLVDRFLYEMSDPLYTIGLLVCLAFMIVGIMQRKNS